MGNEEHVGYLSKEEALDLLEKFVSSNPGVTNDQCMSVLRWASKTRMESDLLDMVANGKIILSIGNKGEMMFSAPKSGAITPAVTSRS
jgi:predicted HTH transcriptional regulator